MKTVLIFLSVIILSAFAFSLQMQETPKIYTTTTGEVSFYSKAPIEDIDAHNNNMTVALSTRYNHISCIVPIAKFEFRLGKMQRDFNERFMDTEKYPIASFTGKINEDINYEKDGTYPVTVTGVLKIHGVEQDRTETGTLTIKGNHIRMASDFKIRVKEFKIKIPRLLSKNIAEVVDVKVRADLVLNEKMTNTLIKL